MSKIKTEEKKSSINKKRDEKHRKVIVILNIFKRLLI